VCYISKTLSLFHSCHPLIQWKWLPLPTHYQFCPFFIFGTFNLLYLVTLLTHKKTNAHVVIYYSNTNIVLYIVYGWFVVLFVGYYYWIELKGRVIKEKMFTCIACTKQTSDERDEDGRESGTPNTKEAVKSLTTQVLTLFLLSPHFLLF
jgi:hypothetical protein